MPAPAQSPHSQSQALDLLHIPHLICSNSIPCHQFPLQASTECNTFSIWLWGSKSLPTPDLAIVILHHRIYLIYPTSYVPTAPPAIDFFHRPVPNATHSVFSFGGQNPCLHVISPSPLSTTTFTLYTPPPILPPCPPLSISITGQYRMCHIWYSALGVKIPVHSRSRHLNPQPPHSPCIHHHQYSHHGPRYLFLSQASTECAAFDTRL
jgi:hypothetical protein